ncbi:hypothetical protein ACYSNR_01585 [Enterococcus sp. LJL128]|uniref:hypothetical protein n=1 Tax=Enterococcus sp. LJL51 TaxID=3416656 RepID=UPI003CF8E640
MLIRFLILAAAILAFIISIYLKKSFPLLAAALKKDISSDFFDSFSRLFLIFGVLGIVTAIINLFYLSLVYIIFLLMLAAVFGISFSKKI